ncbi:hypothetical protein A3C87_02725 [Candidatus Kaiserbacteria bacterium RIFCSPHIGHO2_02_FULL_49_34]|uniref:Uncharacterized protein n=1 Tax=Candidatus Kaiserbacteria bacterium RIFCSPHIGHO2_02_FULL_49_34 TaxID=1798491 RepID=A0A1F6DJE0_9BACT|nr:MAG: hypothetical protein A3C87_02725 [Candidatus Kaiserbacteria bacterium RIFCSPHIGHO2_02_FULL_49_34]
MDCITARKVWSHPCCPIDGLRTTLPDVMDRLEATVLKYVEMANDPFDRKVKEQVTAQNFFITHVDDHDPTTERTHSVLGDAAMNLLLSRYFSGKYRQPIVLQNVCCSGCNIHAGDLDEATILQIQRAAVSIEM